MFGYVIANLSELEPEQRRRYRSVYCAICDDIRTRHGSLCRLALTYDMTFLALLLNGLYEPEERETELRCVVHPVKKHPAAFSPYTGYAADMNVALAYYNCMDDWQDERNAVSLAKAKVLKGETDALEGTFPRQMNAVKSCIRLLSQVEERRDPNPDAGANLFGALMGELFVFREDRWAPTLRELGMALGKFIYLMDACLDLKKDARRGVYNPIAALPDLDRETSLTLLISDCAAAFEKLPVVQDAELLRNILYSGVWTRYRMAEEKKK